MKVFADRKINMMKLSTLVNYSVESNVGKGENGGHHHFFFFFPFSTFLF